MDMHNPVFIISSLMVIVFVVGTSCSRTRQESFDGSKSWSIDNFDWLFLSAGNVFVLFCLALIVLPVGRIRLGGVDARNRISRTSSWFAMLFAAGMGIGLMFWSVAEPAAYYTDWYGTPLDAEKHTGGAQHGDGCDHVPLGAASLGHLCGRGAVAGVLHLQQGPAADDPLGLLPVAQGSNLGLVRARHRHPRRAGHDLRPGHLARLRCPAGRRRSELPVRCPQHLNTQIAIIIGVTAVALISVVRGLDGGVKLLSNINMLLALACCCSSSSPAAGSASSPAWGQTATAYVGYLMPLSNWVGRDDDNLLSRLDGLLLGLVDLLVAVRRHVHRARVEGPHGASSS
jgi:BCCT family betaine/carnitine transporter